MNFVYNVLIPKDKQSATRNKGEEIGVTDSDLGIYSQYTKASRNLIIIQSCQPYPKAPREFDLCKFPQVVKDHA